MTNLPCEKAFIVTIVALFCHFSPKNLEAQSSSRPLIVVANARDAECVRRIGREHFRVEPLFDSKDDARPSNYDACDDRVRGLLHFRLLVFRAETCCPSERFWRERMAAANPSARTHCLDTQRRDAATHWDQQIQTARAIHGLLVSVLPEHRTSLNENLSAELRRLSGLQHYSHQLAVSE